MNSGNLVFQSDGAGGRALKDVLERAAADRLDVHTDFMVRSAAQWTELISANPFLEEAARDPGHLLAMALKSAPAAGAEEALAAAIQGNEVARVAAANAYITYPDGVGRSKLTLARIEAALGVRGTARNWNTVRKLADLSGGARDLV